MNTDDHYCSRCDITYPSWIAFFRHSCPCRYCGHRRGHEPSCNRAERSA